MTTTIWSRPNAKVQHGQSTTEFVVLAVVLVPLMLIIPMIGKYLDIAQTTAIASRYVAFEGTARHSGSAAGWKSDAQLAEEVRRRFFSNTDAPIKSDDVIGDFEAHRNGLWHDHRGDYLLPTAAKHIQVNTGTIGLTQPVGASLAKQLGLSHTNLYRGEVSVQIADVGGLVPFDSIGLGVERHTALLADPWAASGPNAIVSKIRSSNEVFGYRELETVATPINAMISIFEFGAPPPDIGLVEPNRVPENRLGDKP